MVTIGKITFGNSGSGRPTTGRWPDYPNNYTCCCACSLCLSGDCCMNRTYKWWSDTMVWPYVTTQTYAPITTMACAKCGGNTIGTRYHRGTWPTSGGCDHSQRDSEGLWGEHLHRTCQTCGYNWRAPVAGAEG